MMLTTDGSSFLASCENAVDNWTGLGIVKGVASDAAWPFCALAPLLRSVPIRIPIDKVNSSSEKDRNFCLRIVSSMFMDSPLNVFFDLNYRTGAGWALLQWMPPRP